MPTLYEKLEETDIEQELDNVEDHFLTAHIPCQPDSGSIARANCGTLFRMRGILYMGDAPSGCADCLRIGKSLTSCPICHAQMD